MGRGAATNTPRQIRPSEGQEGDTAPPEGVSESSKALHGQGRPASASPDDLLASGEAAARLGISATTLYDWLGRSDRGLLLIRGQSVTIDYLQGGPGGQGRIRIERREVERVRELMRVRSSMFISRRPAPPRARFPGITVRLGRPDRPR